MGGMSSVKRKKAEIGGKTASKSAFCEQDVAREQQILAKIEENIVQDVFFLVMEKLEEKDRKKLEWLCENEDSDTEKFLASKIENFDGFVKKAIQDFAKKFELGAA